MESSRRKIYRKFKFKNDKLKIKYHRKFVILKADRRVIKKEKKNS